MATEIEQLRQEAEALKNQIRVSKIFHYIYLKKWAFNYRNPW